MKVIPVYFGAFKLLWAWFIVPVFNAPILNIPQAIGVSVVVQFLALELTPESHDKELAKEHAVQRIIFSIIAPFIVLAVGLVVRNFL